MGGWLVDSGGGLAAMLRTVELQGVEGLDEAFSGCLASGEWPPGGSRKIETHSAATRVRVRIFSRFAVVAFSSSPVHDGDVGEAQVAQVPE